MMAALPKPSGLFTTLMKWYIANEPDSEFAEFGGAQWGTLKNVKINGRVATGEYTPPFKTDGGEPRRSQLHFIRIDDRWHVDFHASKKDRM